MIEDHDGSALAERITAFKSDPEKMRQVTEYIDKLIAFSRDEAELRQSGDVYETPYFSFLPAYDAAIGNTFKGRLGRARGFVLRMFDALCNCTQNAASAARTSVRNNPFTKR